MEYFAERMGLKPTLKEDGKVADWTFIEKIYEHFIYNKEKIIGEDVGEAYSAHVGHDFIPYLAATASTKAQARALKKLLNIKYMVAEEVKFEKAQIGTPTNNIVAKPIPTKKVVEESKDASDARAHLVSQIEPMMKEDKAIIAIVTHYINKSGKPLKDMDVINLQLLLNSIHEHKKAKG